MTPWQAYDIELDHVVVGAVSLDAGERWLAQRLGVPLQPGGQHAGWGTHNRLLNLGNGNYLELIAADPGQPQPTRVGGNGRPVRRERPFGLDRPDTQRALAQRPRLLHYVMRTPRLQAAVEALDYDCGTVHAMSRGTLTWQIALLEQGMPRLRSVAASHAPMVSVLPTLIDWGSTPHPSTTLPPQGVTLQALRIAAPAPMLIRLGGIVRDPRLILCEATEPSLGLELSSPQGWLMLD